VTESIQGSGRDELTAAPEYEPVSEYVIRDPKDIALLRSSACVDPLGDAITVLSNVRIENPSARPDTEDAANRVALALDYLRMIEREPQAQSAAIPTMVECIKGQGRRDP
jgi:hypothetical protein